MGIKIGKTAAEFIDCQVHEDERGILTVIDSGADFPFIPRRVFYVHEPKGKRGGHAHRKTSQFLFLLSGSLQVTVDDGRNVESIEVSSLHRGILLPPMIWSEQFSFSDSCIYGVLTCSSYDEPDYIRNRSEFERLTK